MPKLNSALKPIFLLVFIFSLLTISPSPTIADTLSWSPVNIPANGPTAKWVLAPGSDLRCLTVAQDGTLYCTANPKDTPYRLFKSTDNGFGWFYAGRVEDNIVAISIMPGNSAQVYYATSSKIYRSDDAGNSFHLIENSPGGAGSDGIEITSLDVASVAGTNQVMAGTRDNDSGQFGGVYVLEGSDSATWNNALVGNYDVVCVAFSPDFATSRQLIAIGTDENDTVVTTNINSAGWNADIGDARLTDIIPVSAIIAFPTDYQSGVPDKHTQYVALSTGAGEGDVFRIEGRGGPDGSELTDLNAGAASGKNSLDITSLAVSGNGTSTNIMAGTAAIAQAFFSPDSGSHWQASQKPPSGNSQTYVTLAPDFAAGGLAFAATSGTESAFSISRDQGRTWGQTSLIDTRITTIRDLAVSPDYAQDDTLMLLTADQQDSLWRSTDAGQVWERIFYDDAARAERIDQVSLAPHYALNQRILLGGTCEGKPAIWESRNGGTSFTQTSSIDPQTQTPVNIDAWILTPEEVLFTAGFDGTNAVVYQTSAGGLNYIDKAVCGNLPINSLAISPDFTDDHTVLAGNIGGGAFISTNGGLVFERIAAGVAGAPFEGNVSVAFDQDYSGNKIVYAAGDAANSGIYRFRTGLSTNWEPIDSTLPEGAKIGTLVTCPDGVLYAVNSQNVDTASRQGGVERCLNPTATAPVFETAMAGLSTGSVLNKLRYSGNNIWTWDAVQQRLLFFSDSLASPISLSSPADHSSGLAIHNIDLTWGPAAGATSYHWQIDMDASFPGNPEESEGETGSNSIRISTLDKDTTYFWRVRTSQPIISPWSEIWSFNTNEIGIPGLSEPRFDSTASESPVFRWSAAQGAAQYQLQLARTSDFAILQKSLTVGINFWECDTVLPYSTRYYWRVKSINGDSQSDWSEVFIFTTKDEPAPPPAPHGLPSSPSPTSSPSALSAPKLSEPKSTGQVSPNPIFRWSATPDAQRYELVVSRYDDFAVLAIDKTGDEACNANVWICIDSLEFGASYYWKVRAVNENNKGPWSEVNVFSTVEEPSPTAKATPSLPANKTPTPTSSPAASPVTQTVPLVNVSPLPSTPPVSTSTPRPAIDSPTPTPSAQATPITTDGPSRKLIYFLIGGLVVLTGILAVVVIYILKKFKKY